MRADDVLDVAAHLEVRPPGAVVARYWPGRCLGLAIHDGTPVVVVEPRRAAARAARGSGRRLFMTQPTSDALPKSPLIGLLLMVAFGLTAIAGLAIGLAHGTPNWVAYLVLPVGAGLFVLYVVFVFLPHVAQVRSLAEMAAAAAALERQLGLATADLQAGDLVATLVHAQELPPRIAAPLANAARALGALVQQIQNSSIEVAASGEHRQRNRVGARLGLLAAGGRASSRSPPPWRSWPAPPAQIAANAASQAELAIRSEQSGDAGADRGRGGGPRRRGGAEADQRDRRAGPTRWAARSKEIYRVLDLITEIAQETHLLSLNADDRGGGRRRARPALLGCRRRGAPPGAALPGVGGVGAVAARRVRRLDPRHRGRDRGGEQGGRARPRAGPLSRGRDRRSARRPGRHRAGGARDLARHPAAAHGLGPGRPHPQGGQPGHPANGAGAQALLRHLRTPQPARALDPAPHPVVPPRLAALAQEPRASAGPARLALPAGHWEALGPQLEEVVRQSPFVELAFVADVHGNMVASSANPEWVRRGHRAPATVTVGLNAKDRPWFQAVARDRRTMITPLYDSLLTGERCFTVAAPVRDASGALARGARASTSTSVAGRRSEDGDRDQSRGPWVRGSWLVVSDRPVRGARSPVFAEAGDGRLSSPT